MKKGNIFEPTSFYLISEKDPENPVWLTEWDYEHCEEDYLGEYLFDIESNIEGKAEDFLNIEKKTLRRNEYLRDYIFGKPFDDVCNLFVDQDCPECEHLLVSHPLSMNYHGQTGLFCSNCDWVCGKIKKDREKIKSNSRRSGKEVKMREPGLSLENFVEKYGLFLRDMKDCIVCNQPIEPNDWFVIRSGYAIVSYEHEGCDNIPSIGTPFTKSEKDKWSKIL